MAKIEFTVTFGVDVAAYAETYGMTAEQAEKEIPDYLDGVLWDAVADVQKTGGRRYWMTTIDVDKVPPPAPPTRSAWVVRPESPGMPFSQHDPCRSGFNSVPCDLQEALNVAGKARNSEIFLCIPNIAEAFRVAVDNHGGPPAYIIDNGTGDSYTVVV